MRIGKFAEVNGLSIDTIRHYMDLGLIIPEKQGGQYYFDSRCQKALEDILDFKSMGFRLNEIKTIFYYKGYGKLTHYQEDGYYKTLFMDRYKMVESEIEKLTEIKAKIEKRIEKLEEDTSNKSSSVGIDIKTLSLFKCVKCNGELTVFEGNVNNNQILEGKLKCSCGELYSIEDGILKVGSPCEQSEVGFDNNYIGEYINATDATYLDNFNKGFEWTCKKIADCNLNNKILLELGTGMGFFLRNIYNELPEDCLYIAVDHNIQRQRFLKNLFERIEYKRNILFICCDFLEIPIKKKSADIVFDITGTSNYSFNHEEFLLNLVDSYVKEDGYLFGTYITFKNFGINSLLEGRYRENFILSNIKNKITGLNYKTIDENTSENINKGGKYENYFVEGEKIATYCFYGKR